jgi:hypothetical protein
LFAQAVNAYLDKTNKQLAAVQRGERQTGEAEAAVAAGSRTRGRSRRSAAAKRKATPKAQRRRGVTLAAALSAEQEASDSGAQAPARFVQQQLPPGTILTGVDAGARQSDALNMVSVVISDDSPSLLQRQTAVPGDLLSDHSQRFTRSQRRRDAGERTVSTRFCAACLDVWRLSILFSAVPLEPLDRGIL